MFCACAKGRGAGAVGIPLYVSGACWLQHSLVPRLVRGRGEEPGNEASCSIAKVE